MEPKIQGTVEAISLVIHLFVKLRIKRYEQSSNSEMEGRKSLQLQMMEKKSKSDLKTNLIILMVLTVYLLLTFSVNRMEPQQANLGISQVQRFRGKLQTACH